MTRGTIALAGSLVLANPVVPWLDRRPAKPAAHPPQAPACRAVALHAQLFLQGATGSLVGGVTFRNTGTRPCALVGRPSVSFTGKAASPSRWRVKRLPPSSAPLDALADPPGSLRALRPGKSASVRLWWSNWCGAPPSALVFRFAHGTIRIPLGGAPRCDAPRYPSTLSVGAYTPTARHLPQSSRLPLRVAIVGKREVAVKPGVRALRVRRGERLSYEVAVTNVGRRVFRFARTSCPTYVEQIVPATPQVYVLNCRPVPAIASHASVRFAMRIDVPAHARVGTSSLTWELAPRTYDAPFAAAALRIAAAGISFHWIQMIDADRGYALSGANTGAYRLLWTTDGGLRWSDVTPGGGTIHPLGPLSIFGTTRLFSVRLGARTYAVERSDDAGRTWHRSLPFVDRDGQAAGQPFALDHEHLFLAVDEGAAAGSQAQALYRSNDGGRRWRIVSRTAVGNARPGTLPFACDKSGFGFATHARGFAGGYCAGGPPFFYRTDDGGLTWRRQTLPVTQRCACETAAPLFFSPTTGATYVTGFSTNGGGRPVTKVLWTYDGGRHWHGTVPTAGRVAQVSFADARSVWVTAQRAGSLKQPFDVLLRTDDAGVHWHATRLPFDAADYRFDALGARTAFGVAAGAFSNSLVVTRDGGATWHRVTAMPAR